MSKIYDSIVTKAAEELVAAMRATGAIGSGSMPTVYAVPTTVEADGQVLVVPYGGEAPEHGVVIMPNSNYASLHKSWYTTPYDHVYSILWQALHNQPILPREKPPTGPYVLGIRERGDGSHDVLLNGNKVGLLYKNYRGYLGCLVGHDGTKINIGEKSLKAWQTEMVKINRAAKAAGRV
jgi:hypothetical protein